MKKYGIYLITLLMTVLAFAACGGDDTSGGGKGGNDPGGGGQGGGGNDEPAPLELNVYLQQGEQVGKDVYARFVGVAGRQILAEISDPKHPELMMINYADESSSHDATMLVSQHNIFIMKHNPYSNTDFPQDALVVGDHDNYSSISVCHVNWETREIEILENATVSFGKSIFTPSAASRRGAIEEAIKRQFLDFAHNLGDVLGEKNGKLEEIGQITKGLGLGDITEGGRKLIKRYNSLVIPSMEYILSSDEEIANRNEVLSQLVSNNLESALTDDILDAVKSYMLRYVPVSEDDLDYALWVYKMSHRDITDEEAANLIANPSLLGDYIGKGEEQKSHISNTLDKVSGVVNSNIGNSGKNEGVTLTVTADNITEQSIQLSGTINITESTYLSYSDVGFNCKNETKSQKVSTTLNGNTLAPATITGLEPATDYIVSAFYIPTASSKTFYSPQQSVVTRGMVFEPSATSIDFEEDGGQKTIDFKLGYGTSWSIVSAPEWCTCSVSGNSLSVKASSSENGRNGKIELQATNYYQEKATRSIGVAQQGSGGGEGDITTWAGTKWELNGTVTSEGETDPLTVHFDFTGLGKGSIKVYLDGETPPNATYSYTVNSDGNIEVNMTFKIYSNHGDVTTDNLTFKLIRTGTNTCTGELNGTESIHYPPESGYQDYSYAITGSFPNGKRIQ
ncbi:MAG: BACON domain-containing protein [Prevotella sp.]|nr:BACON domain-containing protein [Prevotella sp.]